MLLKGALRDLKHAGSDNSRFFGMGWQHTGRNWGNYFQDLSVLEETEEGGALAEVQEISKTCHAVKVVLSAYNLAPKLPKTLQVFREQVNFLAIGDVVCASPWPQWLVKHFAELDIQLAPLPIVF